MAGTLMINTLFGYQPARTDGKDNYYTPELLAEFIVDYFKPSGKVLEPCKGTGSFLKFLPEGTDWCEIDEGRNFFDYKKKVDWIVTNPPFSKITAFMIHSMKLAHNIVFLINTPALFTTKRMREIRYHGFGIKEILFVKQPESFVQTGRQPGAIHLVKGYKGSCVKFTFAENCHTAYKRMKK